MEYYGIDVSSIQSPMDVECMMGDGEKKYLSEISVGKSVIIEVGSWKGGSASIMATSSGGMVYCVDWWMGSASDPNTTKEAIDDPMSVYLRFLANTSKAGFLGHSIVPVMGRSEDLSKYFKDGSADLVMIDGSHFAEDVLMDLRMFYPKVRPGGILCGHDWHLPGPQQAVKSFSAEEGIQYTIPVLTGWGMWEFRV